MEQNLKPSAACIPPAEVSIKTSHHSRLVAAGITLAATALGGTTIGVSHAEAPVQTNQLTLTIPKAIHPKHFRAPMRKNKSSKHVRQKIEHTVQRPATQDPVPSHYLTWMKKRDSQHCTGVDSWYSMYRIGMVCKGDRGKILYDIRNPKTGQLVSQFVQVRHHGRVLCGAVKPNVITASRVDPTDYPRCDSYYQKRALRNHFARKGRSNAAPGECVGGTRFEPIQEGQKTLYANFATNRPSPSNLYPTKDNSGFYDRVGSLDPDEPVDYRFQFRYGSAEGRAAMVVSRLRGWVAVHDSGHKDLVPGVPQGDCLQKADWMVAGSHPVSDAPHFKRAG